jgi:hypothetical protein
MTVSDLLQFLKDQPPNAVVLIAGEKHTFGDRRASAFAAFTYAGEPEECFVSRAIIHPDDCVELPNALREEYIPIVVIGAP